MSDGKQVGNIIPEGTTKASNGVGSPRQNDTRGDNMKKRERDREFGIGARVVVNEKAPGGYVARLGMVLEIVLDSRYGVKFDNQKELTVYLDSECLDPVPQVRSSPNRRRVDKARMRVR